MSRHKTKGTLKSKRITIRLPHPKTSKAQEIEIDAWIESPASFLALHNYISLSPKGRWGYEVKTDTSRWVITHIPTGMAVGQTIDFWTDRDEAEAYLRALDGPEWDFNTLSGITEAVFKKWAVVHSQLHKAKG